MAESDGELLTVEEAMSRLRISRPTLYKLINSGELLSMKLVGSRRIPAYAIRDYVMRRVEAELAKINGGQS